MIVYELSMPLKTDAKTLYRYLGEAMINGTVAVRDVRPEADRLWKRVSRTVWHLYVGSMFLSIAIEAKTVVE